MRHLIDPTDLTVAETEQIVALAEDIIANRAKYSESVQRGASWRRSFTSLRPAPA